MQPANHSQRSAWTDKSTRKGSLFGDGSLHHQSKADMSKEGISADLAFRVPFSTGRLEDFFTVENEHCRGGYGAVYKGHYKNNLSQKVAIKAFFPNHRPYYALQEIIYMLLLEPFEGFTKVRGIYTHCSYIFIVGFQLQGDGLGRRRLLLPVSAHCEPQRPDMLFDELAEYRQPAA